MKNKLNVDQKKFIIMMVLISSIAGCSGFITCLNSDLVAKAIWTHVSIDAAVKLKYYITIGCVPLIGFILGTLGINFLHNDQNKKLLFIVGICGLIICLLVNGIKSAISSSVNLSTNANLALYIIFFGLAAFFFGWTINLIIFLGNRILNKNKNWKFKYSTLAHAAWALSVGTVAFIIGSFTVAKIVDKTFIFDLVSAAMAIAIAIVGWNIKADVFLTHGMAYGSKVKVTRSKYQHKKINKVGEVDFENLIEKETASASDSDNSTPNQDEVISPENENLDSQNHDDKKIINTSKNNSSTIGVNEEIGSLHEQDNSDPDLIVRKKDFSWVNTLKYILLCVTLFLIGGMQFSVSFWMPYLFSNIGNLVAKNSNIMIFEYSVGGFFLSAGIISLFYSLISKVLSKIKIQIFIFILLVIFVSFYGVVFLNATTYSLGLLIVFASCAGLGFGFINNRLIGYIMDQNEDSNLRSFSFLWFLYVLSMTVFLTIGYSIASTSAPSSLLPTLLAFSGGIIAIGSLLIVLIIGITKKINLKEKKAKKKINELINF